MPTPALYPSRMSPAAKPRVAPRPAGVPQSIEISMDTHAPYADPTMGVAVPRAASASRPRHRLVTIGDSLTHGFQSGAIFNTRLSWPRIVAWEMGWDAPFRFPTYDAFGGLPVNLEYIIRDLEQHYGDNIGGLEYALAGFRVSHLLSQIEDHWERGAGATPPLPREIMHNLAVYGWDLRDALSHNWNTLRERVAQEKPRDNWLTKQVVEKANERAALRVYPPASSDAGAQTLFESAAALGAEGGLTAEGAADPACPGIETLVVALGANNCLGTITSLRPVWSGPGYADLDGKREFNVWDPHHFDAEYAQVVAAIEPIRARHVILANVPHVTISPIARGVGTKVRPDSRYFPFYTRPWITDAQFNPADDPHLSAEMVRAIDSAIDQYNATIAAAVHAARAQGRDWYLLDLCGVLDRLAVRRYHDSPQARPAWWEPYELPAALQALEPPPTSRFFASGPEGRTAGGIFSLDGVHPTTIGYGIFAQEVIRVMQLAGVVFEWGNGAPRRGAVEVDFERLIRLDTLISKPPRSLTSDMRFIGWVDETFDFFRGMFRRG